MLRFPRAHWMTFIDNLKNGLLKLSLGRMPLPQYPCDGSRRRIAPYTIASLYVSRAYARKLLRVTMEAG